MVKILPLAPGIGEKSQVEGYMQNLDSTFFGRFNFSIRLSVISAFEDKLFGTLLQDHTAEVAYFVQLLRTPCGEAIEQIHAI